MMIMMNRIAIDISSFSQVIFKNHTIGNKPEIKVVWQYAREAIPEVDSNSFKQSTFTILKSQEATTETHQPLNSSTTRKVCHHYVIMTSSLMIHLGRVTRTAFQANSISQCDMWCRDIEAELRRAMLAQFNRPGKESDWTANQKALILMPSSSCKPANHHQPIGILKFYWSMKSLFRVHTFHIIILKHRQRASLKSRLVSSQSQSVLGNHSNFGHKSKVNLLQWSNG